MIKISLNRFALHKYLGQNSVSVLLGSCRVLHLHPRQHIFIFLLIWWCGGTSWGPSPLLFTRVVRRYDQPWQPYRGSRDRACGQQRAIFWKEKEDWIGARDRLPSTQILFSRGFIEKLTRVCGIFIDDTLSSLTKVTTSFFLLVKWQFKLKSSTLSSPQWGSINSMDVDATAFYTP